MYGVRRCCGESVVGLWMMDAALYRFDRVAYVGIVASKGNFVPLEIFINCRNWYGIGIILVKHH